MKLRHYSWILIGLILLAFRSADHVRIILIGDSTMANKPHLDLPERGWGQVFAEFFNQEVELLNFAVNGESTSSYIREGKWQQVLDQLQPGDWLLIQFGHNDSHRYDSTHFTDPQTSYRENLRRFVSEAEAKGAHPVLITPVNRRKFNSRGAFEDTHGQYPDAVRSLATEMQVPLIDLHKSSEQLLCSMGEKESVRLFRTSPPHHYAGLPNGITDNTHFSLYGARQVAALVAREIRDKHLPLAAYLKKPGFEGIYQFDLPLVYEPHFRRDTFDITHYGAVSDGQTLNTRAINEAISDCSARGGGVVLIPPGFWLSGPIVLRDSVNLHLAANALLQFTADHSQYPLYAGNWEGLPAARNQSPISATDASNIAITGQGIIDGNGQSWRMVKKDKLTATEWKKLIASGGVVQKDTWYPSEESMKGAAMEHPGVLLKGKTLNDYRDIKDFLRPNMVVLTRCHNILLEGVTFQNSPAWNLHPFLCTDLTVRNVRASNPWYAQNGDGIDIESCRNVLVENSSFDVGDDGICIKSGRDAEGRKRATPTENLLVRNCVVYHAHGGFVIGSEMSGGARNLFVSNCTFIGTDIGLRFKTTRGRGGVVEKIYCDSIFMKDMATDAIRFDMYYAAKDPVLLAGEKRQAPTVETHPVDETTPRFRNFHISHIVCQGADRAIFVRGLPEMNIEDIHLSDLVLDARQGVECTQATGLTLENLKLITRADQPAFLINESRNLLLSNISCQPVTHPLADISGSGSSGIRWKNVQVKDLKSLIRLSDGAGAQAYEIQ